MEIKLEDNIPVPTAGSGRREAPITGALRKMTPGQSFLCTAEELHSVRPITTRMKRLNPGTDFTVRKQDDGTYRVWRLS